MSFTSNKPQVMLDIETLGIGPNACIAAIGAYKFNTDTVFDGDYIKEDAFCFTLPWEGDIDHDTLRWWLGQSEEARRAICLKAPYTVTDTLRALVEFIDGCPVWGNGSDFDNVIVLSACKRNNVKGWSHRNNRCFRTVKNIFEPNAYTKPVVGHNALYDAIAQAQTLAYLAKKYNIPL